MIKMPFQTMPLVCDYMVNLLCGPNHNAVGKILEPTAGEGNLVCALKKRHPNATITAPKDFWKLDPDSHFDHAVMNPPFTPMVEGYRYLEVVMNICPHIVALLPWFILINSERRIKAITNWGLISVTHLPRKTFPGTRIQCCVLHMNKGYSGKTILNHFEF